jgi:hypothetical protein
LPLASRFDFQGLVPEHHHDATNMEEEEEKKMVERLLVVGTGRVSSCRPTQVRVQLQR